MNPGNNLHVSGLHHKVDTRVLEQAFAKVGRVSAFVWFLMCAALLSGAGDAGQEDAGDV